MLDETGSKIKTERSTTKSPLTDEDVQDLLDSSKRVVIARGRSSRELKPSEAKLDDLKGPSGKYRAPMMLFDRVLYVGYCPAALDELYMFI